MNSSGSVLLVHGHTIEQVQEVEEFTIRFKIGIVGGELDATERSFSFPLEEFIGDDETPEKEEFYYFLIDSAGDDDGQCIFIDLVVCADDLRRRVYRRDLRAVLTVGVTIVVIPEGELDAGMQEALLEAFFGTENIPFRPASGAAIESFLVRKQSCGNDVNCAICLEEVAAGERVASLPCVHEFHDQCIVKWLRTSHLCPLCRFQLPYEPLTNNEQ